MRHELMHVKCNTKKIEQATASATAKAAGLPPAPSLPAKHRLGITNVEWEQLIRGLEENPDAKTTRSRKKKQKQGRRAVTINPGTRVKVQGNNKSWRLGTVVSGAGDDVMVSVVYDFDPDAAPAGIETFSTTTDEWDFVDEK